MVVPKYAVALLQFTVLLVTSLSVSLQGGFDKVEIAQFISIAAGAGITFFVPLVKGPWSGALKTGFALVATLATAVIPFIIAGAITPDQIMIIVLAALNVVMSELGVSMRTTVIDAGLAVSGQPVSITSLDREGVSALHG